MIETLVVDLGGVAARFRPERRLAALASLSGLSPQTVHERLFDSGLDLQAELGAFDQHQIVTAINEALGTPIPVSDLVDAWSLAFDLDTAMLSYISVLPLRAVVFTNNGPMLDACLRGPLAGLRDSFSQVICSWHVVAPANRTRRRSDGRPSGLAVLPRDCCCWMTVLRTWLPPSARAGNPFL